MVYLLVEIISLSLYALIVSRPSSESSLEAGLRYFVQGVVGSAIFLVGSSLIYAASGCHHLALDSVDPLATTGCTVLTLALFVKVGLVPGHLIVAETYAGAPRFAAILLSLAPRLALLPPLVALAQLSALRRLFIASATVTVILAPFAALLATNVAKLLAHSGTTMIGYILLMLVDPSPLGGVVSCIWFVAYQTTLAGIWCLVTSAVDRLEAGTLLTLRRLQGIGIDQPARTFSLAMLTLSTAGVPPLGGFFLKQHLLTSLISNG